MTVNLFRIDFMKKRIGKSVNRDELDDARRIPDQRFHSERYARLASSPEARSSGDILWIRDENGSKEKSPA